MALPMSRPFRHATGAYYLNVRIASDLVERARGVRVVLPIAGQMVAVRLTDKCFVSLRTKEANHAKVRFGPALASLVAQLEALRAGPRPLAYKQVVALAGEIYRARTRRDAANPTLGPEVLATRLQEQADLIADLRRGRVAEEDDNLWALDAEEACIMAHAEGDQADFCGDPAAVLEPGYEVAKLEHIYGPEVDGVLAAYALNVDGETRTLLLREVSRAAKDAARATIRNMAGDFSPDVAEARFPAFVPQQSTDERRARRSPGEKVDVATLFERWCAVKRERKAGSTLRRYAPSLASLNAFVERRDIRAISDDDVWAWAEHRRDKDGISAATINRNDLAAAQAVFAWATTREGGKIRKDNPVEGVRLELAKVQSTRPSAFFAHEAAAILVAAREVEIDPTYPRASASRRWTSWICAYTGARIQEVCWLQANDIWCEGGIWVIRFPQTKDGNARTVPIHEELKREGLLTFVSQVPTGYLFVGDRPRKEGAKRSLQEQRASELAEWVRSKVKLAAEISPNHAWRHTFITRAEAAGVPKRLSNALTGHNKARDASDGYVSPDISLLKVQIDKVPVFDLSARRIKP